MTNEPRCPICDELLSYDEVDIGVGIQTGNYRCDYCGWYPERDDEECGVDDEMGGWGIDELEDCRDDR